MKQIMYSDDFHAHNYDIQHRDNYSLQIFDSRHDPDGDFPSFLGRFRAGINGGTKPTQLMMTVINLRQAQKEPSLI